MHIEQPFHEGELRAQALAGESAMAARNQAVIADSIMKGALPFLRTQRMLVMGSIAADGTVWASPLFGEPGFVEAPDPQTVLLHRTQSSQDLRDPLWENLAPDAAVGLLAIELATRRRLRVNGVVDALSPESLRIAVREAYPNCPKYIQRRNLLWDDASSPAATDASAVPAERGYALNDAAAAMVRQADTLFVASAHPTRGADVSHRGGNPGFLKLLESNRIRVPDYAGNSMYNTLGNLLVDPRAGVTILDFAGSRALQMTGQAEVLWGHPDPENRTGGTFRFWDFQVEAWQILPLPASARWDYVDASPYNPRMRA